MKRSTGFLLAGLFVALLLAGVVSNFASSAPDGLDAAATRGCTVDAAGTITGGTCMAQGEKAHETSGSPLADYSLAGFDNAYLSTGLSGVAGVLVTFLLAGGVFWVARGRQADDRSPAGRTVGTE